MFLAPFGMLIRGGDRAFVQVPFGLIFVILAHGSAVTVFSGKWMGKLVTVTRNTERVEGVLRRVLGPHIITTS